MRFVTNACLVLLSGFLLSCDKSATIPVASPSISASPAASVDNPVSEKSAKVYEYTAISTSKNLADSANLYDGLFKKTVKTTIEECKKTADFERRSKYKVYLLFLRDGIVLCGGSATKNGFDTKDTWETNASLDPESLTNVSFALDSNKMAVVLEPNKKGYFGYSVVNKPKVKESQIPKT
jgi:hypothetical protein